MWKAIQNEPRITATIDQPMPATASSQMSRKSSSPAYMLPKSRSEWDNGFEMYSTTLKAKFAGHRRGFDPNGEQKSSWMNPPSPFTLMAVPIIRNQIESASAKVVFTSAVGTIRN